MRLAGSGQRDACYGSPQIVNSKGCLRNTNCCRIEDRGESALYSETDICWPGDTLTDRGAGAIA
jgi:hypothetical protein